MMSSTLWKVIGASGFVGSSIMDRLAEEGIAAEAIEAPRLVTQSHDTESILTEAHKLESVLDSLADAFAGAHIIINASGIAAPNSQDIQALDGANALLPALIVLAAQRTGVRRVIHLSSVAVLGAQAVLTAEEKTHPFSAYSYSKALGEAVLLKIARQGGPEETTAPSSLEICMVRATSVQGAGRQTTEAFANIATSFLASVAGDGQQKSPVSSNLALAEFVVALGKYQGKLPAIVLQPWEGATCASVIQDAGRRNPVKIPRPLAKLAIEAGYQVSEFLGGRFQGTVRRVEVMWFGQDLDDSWAREHHLVPESRVQDVLRNAHTALGHTRDAKF